MVRRSQRIKQKTNKRNHPPKKKRASVVKTPTIKLKLAKKEKTVISQKLKNPSTTKTLAAKSSTTKTAPAKSSTTKTSITKNAPPKTSTTKTPPATTSTTQNPDKPEKQSKPKSPIKKKKVINIKKEVVDLTVALATEPQLCAQLCAQPATNGPTPSKGKKRGPKSRPKVPKEPKPPRLSKKSSAEDLEKLMQKNHKQKEELIVSTVAEFIEENATITDVINRLLANKQNENYNPEQEQFHHEPMNHYDMLAHPDPFMSQPPDISIIPPIIPPMDDMANKNFPEKIWDIVNDDKRYFCMWWYDDRRSFLINKQWVRRPGQILDPTDTMFNTTNYQSLVRQLNLYGFRKVKRSARYLVNGARYHGPHYYSEQPHQQDIDEFRHTFFRGDQPPSVGKGKIKYIKRQKPFKPTNKEQAPHPWKSRDGNRSQIARSPSWRFSDTQSTSYDDDAYNDADHYFGIHPAAQSDMMEQPFWDVPSSSGVNMANLS